MLMHQEEQNIPTSTAAGERVTPEELARAAATLEAKQAAERQRHTDTIPLGEAVQQLGMNVTPDALLAEVEALRAAGKKRSVQVEFQRKYKLANRLAAVVVTVVIGSMIFFVYDVFTHRPNHTLAVIPLSQAADGQTIHCDIHTVEQLASGIADPAKVLVDARPESSRGAQSDMFNKEWALIRSGGQYIIRAWATADQALRTKNEQSATVFSNRPPWLPSANLVRVDVPLNRFQDLASDRIAGYDAKGAQSTAAAGAVEVVETQGVEGLIDHALRESDSFNYPLDRIEVSVGSGRVLLTGTVSTAVKKQAATRLAVATLGKLGLTDSVANEITTDK